MIESRECFFVGERDGMDSLHDSTSDFSTVLAQLAEEDSSLDCSGKRHLNPILSDACASSHDISVIEIISQTRNFQAFLLCRSREMAPTNLLNGISSTHIFLTL